MFSNEVKTKVRKSIKIKNAALEKKSANRVTKHNDLINASYNLDTTEQRLILLAISEVRRKDKDAVIDANTIIDIPASSYVEMFGTGREAAYLALRDAGLSLKRREFTFISARNGIVHGGWLQHVEYVEKSAILSLAFTTCVIPYISQLEENFTSYEINQISGLKSKYAIRLYELLIQWQNNKDCDVPVFKIEDLRAKMGLTSEDYPRLNNLKARVIVPAIEQINKHTNINIVDVEQFKTGRVVDRFKFKYEKKHKEVEESRNDKPETGFIKLTLEQLNMFSRIMSKMPDLSFLAHGNESYEQLEAKIFDLLQDPERQEILTPYLMAAGYKETKKKKPTL